MAERSLFARLADWFCRPPPLTRLNFVLYTRRGCHLCDVAHEQLVQAQTRHGFGLTVLDVDADPSWQKQYGHQVPVIVVNGKVRFWGRINPVLLARLLDGERGRSSE